jgi:hypothetical protein
MKKIMSFPLVTTYSQSVNMDVNGQSIPSILELRNLLKSNTYSLSTFRMDFPLGK